MCKIQHQKNKSILQKIDGKINAWPFELSNTVGLGCNPGYCVSESLHS